MVYRIVETHNGKTTQKYCTTERDVKSHLPSSFDGYVERNVNGVWVRVELSETK